MSITAYIKNDLQQRFASGAPFPGKFTLMSVADLYRVSVTPVRAAISELIAEGVLCKGENRRLFPANGDAVQAGEMTAADAAKPSPGPPAPPSDLLDTVANDLVRLSLQGKVVQLREEATAEKYGVSRSAMRNIFHRLAGTGLITHVPRRGWVLRPFRQEDMQSFLEIRETLELKALELARPRLRDKDLQRILDGNRFPETDDAWPSIDNSLHSYLIDKAGNAYIADFFERQGRYYDILFDWEDLDRDTAIETVRQHREILEALLAHDWRQARKSLSWHIRCNHPILSNIVAGGQAKGGESRRKSDGPDDPRQTVEVRLRPARTLERPESKLGERQR